MINRFLILKKILILLVISFFLLNLVKADLSRNVPEAGSFNSVGGGGDAGYTGDLSIGVPLMNVPGRNDFDLPLSLSYSAGIRLEDEASWVGLGWNLGAGVITRAINGVPDDFNNIPTYLPPPAPSHLTGWLYNDCGLPGKPACGLGNDFADQDFYSISFSGGNDRLFATDIDSWHTQNWKSWKIIPHYDDANEDGVPDGKILSWEVISEDGTRFIFGKYAEEKIQLERKTLTCYKLNNDFGEIITTNYRDLEQPYIYAWYLTEVLSNDYVDTNSNGLDDSDYGNWIKIKYTIDDIFYPYVSPHINSNIKPTYNEYVGGARPNIKNIIFNYNYDTWSRKYTDRSISLSYSQQKKELQRYYITEIETPTHIASFNLDFTLRKDAKSCPSFNCNNPGVSPPVLDYILLKSKTDPNPNNFIKKIKFEYTHELAKGSEGDPDPNIGKLTLKEIRGYGENNGALPPTTFEYYDTGVNYYREAWDWWGYYNGKTINKGYKIVEKCLDSSVSWENLIYETRISADHESYVDARTWSLKKIIYPTGGSIEYDYDIDRYDYEQNIELSDTMYGGGIRLIKKIIKDGMGETSPHVITTTYGYGDGVTTRVLDFGKTRSDWDRVSNRLILNVGYRDVTTNIVESGDYGKIKTYYTTAIEYPDTGVVTCPDNNPLKYTTIYESKRGLPIRTEYYHKNIDGTFREIMSSANTYNFASKASFYENSVDTDPYYKQDCNYDYYIYSIWPPLTQTETINYDNPSNPITITTEYSYNSNNGLPGQVTETNTNNEKRITLTNYTVEFPEYYQDMINKNMISQPAVVNIFKDTVDWDIGNLKSRTIYHYENTCTDPICTGTNSQFNLRFQDSWLDRNRNGNIETGEYIVNSYTYDNYGNIKSTTDPLQHTTTLFYGDSGQCTDSNTFKHSLLTCVRNNLNQEVKSYYNNDGTVSSIKDANNIDSYYNYDEFNRLISATTPTQDTNDPSTSLITYTYRYAYDNGGIGPTNTNYVKTSVLVEDGKNFESAQFWDGLGRTHQNDLMSNPGVEHIRNYVLFNELGVKKQESKAYTETSNLPQGLVTKLLVGLNLMEAPKDPERLNEYIPVEESTAAQDAYLTYYVYEDNPLARVKELYPFGSCPNPCPADYADCTKCEPGHNENITTSYGASTIDGIYYRNVTVTDEEGKTSTSYYDKFGNLVRVVNPEGGITKYEYDILGRLTKVTNPQNQITLNEYDTLGRLIKTTNPDFGTIEYTYDDNDNLKTKTQNSKIITYTYDVLDRLSSYNTGLRVITNTYDSCINGVGKICQITDSGENGFSVTYEYMDPKGRLTVEQQRIGAKGPYYIYYTYDKADNLKTITDPTDPDGIVTEYFYNNLNQIEKVETDGQPVIKDYTYGESGTVDKIIYGNDITTDYTYTARNWIESISTIKPGTTPTTLFARSYNYDLVGNIEYLYGDASKNNLLASFAYDPMYRLKTVTDYNYYGKSIDPTNPPKLNFAYTYDLIGNRQTETKTINNNPQPTTSYLYEWELPPGKSSRLKEDNTYVYTYDSNGNLLTKKEKSSNKITSYEYDSEDRLTKIKYPDNTYSKYYYNPDGLRILKIDPDSATRYIYSGSNVIYEEYVYKCAEGSITSECVCAYGIRNSGSCCVGNKYSATATCPAFCGNGICEAGETSAKCKKDCPPTPKEI